MIGMSERDYATHAGISRGAVQKARKSGRLVLFADGSINAAGSDARRAEMTDPDQQRRATGRTSGGGFTGTATGGSDSSVASNPGDSTSYLKARTALTVYQAQERQLAIQRKKGALVDKARAEALVFRLAQQERDAWVTWPARVAAMMAAELAAAIDKETGEKVTIGTAILQNLLETHVRAQLDAIAELRVALG